MRQEHGPKMPGSRFPLPFSAPPVADLDLDPENDRIEGLHAELQRRVEELEKLEGHPEDGDSKPATPHSARSSVSVDAAPTAATGREGEAASERCDREYIGGQLPEHSRALVEKLMEEEDIARHCADEITRLVEERDKAHEPASTPPAEETLEDDRDAVAKMLAAADALGTEDLDPLGGGRDYLSYENVVQRSRASLEAGGLLVRD